jgi:hypothetical protein
MVKKTSLWALALFVFTATVVALSTQAEAHDEATCCSDPCELFEVCKPNCPYPCYIHEEAEVFYYADECDPQHKGEEDRCRRVVCFYFTKINSEGPCNSSNWAQCCSDDSALCI